MQPLSSPKAKIEVHSRSSSSFFEQLKVGDPVQTSLEIINISEESQGMVVANVAVPSFMKLDVNQFEILKSKKAFDHYEISPDLSSYTIYWTSIKPYSSGDVKKFEVTLVKDFEAVASHQLISTAYLYYENEHKVYF